MSENLLLKMYNDTICGITMKASSDLSVDFKNCDPQANNGAPLWFEVQHSNIQEKTKMFKICLLKNYNDVREILHGVPGWVQSSIQKSIGKMF